MKRMSSATTSSRVGSDSSPMISRSTQGLPCAARPTMTAAAPVEASTACALAREVMSPDAITGTPTSSTNSAVSAWSASPVYICLADRGCNVSVAAPTSTSRGPTSRQAREPFSRPRLYLHRHGDVYCLGDRGHDPAGTIRIVEQRRARSRLRDLPDGQPKLMSTRSAPAASTIRAASAMTAEDPSRRSGPRADARRQRYADSPACARSCGGARRSSPSPSRRARRRSGAPGGEMPARSRRPSAPARAGSGSRPGRCSRNGRSTCIWDEIVALAEV